MASKSKTAVFTGVSVEKGEQQVKLRSSDVSIDAALRARHFPPSESEVYRMAVSLVRDGQEQPIVVRTVRKEDEKTYPMCTAGVTRTLAGRLVESGFTDPHTKAEYPANPDFRLNATVKGADITEHDAFKVAVTENLVRTQTSKVDDAFNHEKLRQDGMKDKDIAEFYQIDKAEVSRLKKMLELDEPTLFLVHTGELPFYSAVELVSVKDEATRARIIKDTGGALAAVKEAVRSPNATVTASSTTPDSTTTTDGTTTTGNTSTTATTTDAGTGSGSGSDDATGNGSGSGSGSGRMTQRTVKQVTNLFSRYTGDETNILLRTAFKLVLGYTSGEMTEADVQKAIAEIDPVKGEKKA